MQLDYRKLAKLLKAAPSLAATVGLKKGNIPHFTTFQKASCRLLRSKPGSRLLDRTVEEAVKQKITRKRI